VRRTALFIPPKKSPPAWLGGLFFGLHSGGPGGSGWPGSGPVVGAEPMGAPLPPATPAMSAIGAPGRPPNAISGAPAGTATGSGAPAGTGAPAGNGSPAGIGAPTGSGAATGAPAMSAIAAPAGAHAAPAAPTAPTAPAAPAAAGAATSPADPYIHAPPPVFSGAAIAPGLSAIAAPHSPMPATTLMLNRSKVVIDVNSLSRPGRSTRCSRTGPSFFGQLIFSGPVFNTHYATRDRCQIETFHPISWTAKRKYRHGLSDQARPIITMTRRNLHQPLMFESKHHKSASKTLWARALPPSSADVGLAAGGVSATVSGDVHVVVVAITGSGRTAGRVVRTAPDAILQ
jgi:hypothetical protein